jgi:adenylate cyclase
LERKLVAILAADVVGYSRMIRSDEDATIAALRELRRDVIDPAIARFRGRIVKLMGDGILAEFASVVDAVAASAEIQQDLALRNTGIPEDRRVVFRMGVNLGDVVIDGDDIQGDGVNVASRLEGIAEPGGIWLSGSVYEQVRDRLELQFEDLGERTVKNIDRPVRVYRWLADGIAPSAAPSVAEMSLPLPVRPSIAVLPFNNMSGDPEQEYFSDGMTEDIITDLSKVSGLFVIARNSSFAYKGQSPDIRKVSRELGVRYVLEGSVRRAGERVRINAQLIEGPTGGHVWADRFDRKLEDIFEVQDEVTREIVNALKVALTPEEKSRRAVKNEVNAEAYDLVVRAREKILRFTEDSAREGRELIERAIEVDPEFALAYAALSMVTGLEYANRWNGADETYIAKSLQLAETARRKNENEPRVYHALAVANLRLKNLEAAEQAARKGLELDPNSGESYTALASVKEFLGNHEDAIMLAQKALRLDPYYSPALQILARAQFSLKQYRDAEKTLKTRLSRESHSDIAHAYLASVYGHTGRKEEARETWCKLMEIKPDFKPDYMWAHLAYKNPAPIEDFIEGLRRAGLAD